MAMDYWRINYSTYRSDKTISKEIREGERERERARESLCVCMP